MTQHSEPAAGIIERLGGVTKVAVRTGRDPSAVRRWRLPPPEGCGGVIPEYVRPDLLQMAVEMAVELTYADFAPLADEAPAPAPALANTS